MGVRLPMLSTSRVFGPRDHRARLRRDGESGVLLLLGIVFHWPMLTRGRVNAIFMTINFIGGAIGSFLGTLTNDFGGWTLTAATRGTMCVLLLLIFFLTD